MVQADLREILVFRLEQRAIPTLDTSKNLRRADELG